MNNALPMLEHGTGAMYTDRRCRCTECVEWHELYEKKAIDYMGTALFSIPEKKMKAACTHRVTTKKAAVGAPPVHGAGKMYNIMACRCAVCVRWKLDYRLGVQDFQGKPKGQA